MTAPDASPPPPRKPLLIKILVGGLPLGLVVMGALSFVLYFHQKNQRETPHPSQFAALLRKDLNDAEYQRYRCIFSQDLGDRSAGQTANREAAASFIHSTLGLDNMGYEVVRHESGPRGQSVTQLEAELTGKKFPRRLVLVAARYDNTDTSAIPALLCLAHAFTGESHANTVRFLALAAGADGTALANYRTWIAKSDWDRVDLVVLGSAADRALIHGAFGRDVNSVEEIPLSQDAPLAEVKGIEKKVRELADKE